MSRSREVVRDHWRGVLERLAGSNLSAAEFCRRETIRYWKLMNWKRKLVGEELFVAGSGSFAELLVEKSACSIGAGRGGDSVAGRPPTLSFYGLFR